MRTETVRRRMEGLLKQGLIKKSSSILCVCADMSERDLFQSMGFKNVTISNINQYNDPLQFAPFKVDYQDLMNLSYAEGAFDLVFVSDGIHHCSSPHKAVTEMYRVCKKGIIVFESRDSLLIQILVFLHLVPSYEIEAVLGNGMACGGVNNTDIPNYIYRWTEREFEKTINSFYPVGKNRFLYFYDLNIPARMNLRKYEGVFQQISQLVKKQCNSFCMIALKPTIPNGLWGWVRRSDSGFSFKGKA